MTGPLGSRARDCIAAAGSQQQRNHQTTTNQPTNQPQQNDAVQQQPPIFPPVHCMDAELASPRCCRGQPLTVACRDAEADAKRTQLTCVAGSTNVTGVLCRSSRAAAHGGGQRHAHHRKGLVFDPKADLRRVSCPVLSPNRRSPHPLSLSPSLT